MLREMKTNESPPEESHETRHTAGPQLQTSLGLSGDNSRDRGFIVAYWFWG